MSTSKNDGIVLHEYDIPSPTATLLQQDIDHIPEDEDNTDRVIIHKSHKVHLHSSNWRHSRLLRVQIALCFLLFALDGAADQTVGTLMPFLVEHYHTTQTHISIVFMLQFLGYLLSAFSNEYLHRLFGKRGVLICATLGMSTCFIINSLVERLGVYIAVHVFYGMGAGLSASSVNVFMSTVVDHNEIMGMLHGCYGLGSMLSPPTVSWILVHWGYRVYYGILGTVGIISMISVWFVFRHETKWKYDYLTPLESSTTGDDDDEVNQSVFSLVFNPIVLCFCIYLFFYAGVEVATGSWLLTYLKEVKSLEQMDAAIVVSWFWIGLTIGRIVLGFVTKIFRSEYRANLLYSIASWITFSAFTVFAWMYSGAHFVIWAKLLVFSMGVFIGPLFPTASVVLMKILPVHLHVSGLGVSASLGGSGAAAIPFFVGICGRWFGFKYLLIIINTALLIYTIVWVSIKPVAQHRTKYQL